MRILPLGKDEWINLLLLPFKTYVVAIPIVGHILSLIVQGSWRSRAVANLIQSGFFFCVPILLFGALLQATICKRGESLKTVCFAVWALLILFFPMFYPPFKYQAVLVIALNVVVLCYSLVAFLRTKQPGFILLLLGCVISCFTRITSQIWNRPDTFFGGNYGAYQDFITIVQLASLAAQFLWAVGILLIIHQVLITYSTNPSPTKTSN